MDVLTFISVIFVSLVIGFTLMVYIVSKLEYAKVTEENIKLRNEISKLKNKNGKGDK